MKNLPSFAVYKFIFNVIWAHFFSHVSLITLKSNGLVNGGKQSLIIWKVKTILYFT